MATGDDVLIGELRLAATLIAEEAGTMTTVARLMRDAAERIGRLSAEVHRLKQPIEMPQPRQPLCAQCNDEPEGLDTDQK